jgi:hypothetical protein
MQFAAAIFRWHRNKLTDWYVHMFLAVVLHMQTFITSKCLKKLLPDDGWNNQPKLVGVYKSQNAVDSNKRL